MLKIKVLTHDETRIIDANKGNNLLTLLAKNNIILPANCGGKGTCGKCRVTIIDEILQETTIALSCQYSIEKSVTVNATTIMGEGLIKSISNDFDVRPAKGTGIALDLGTTTIAAYLIDLSSGKQLDAISQINRQAVYGSDVISRIDASKAHLKDLQRLIINQINIIIAALQKNRERVSKMTVSGNMTMLHLLLGVDPSSMGVSPFTPVFTQSKKLYGDNLGINCSEVILLPSASAFIGSDIVAGILACDIIDDNKVNLFIDIGTNGEIVLSQKGNLYACATACGPAFEGAKIEMGMGGVNGAVSHISFSNGKLEVKTISGEAYGICGSGLIDCIALLIDNRLIEENGSFNNSSENILKKNLKETKFYITEKVYITQGDIREFQLAKSAVISGIIALLDECNLVPEDIDNVYLAGGFGYYIDTKNAIKAGLLPGAFQEKIISVGNSSGQGAKMCLLNNDYLEKCKELSNKIKILDLTANPKFIASFIENMSFD